MHKSKVQFGETLSVKAAAETSTRLRAGVEQFLCEKTFCEQMQVEQRAEGGAGGARRHAPVVGVLCIDISTPILDAYESKAPHSYIAASYVKFVESAGARVVPIWIGREKNYYEEIISKINGVLIPGGAVYLSDEENEEQEINEKKSNDCVLSAKYIYEIATKLNDSGECFPIWGTCLGFQLLLTHAIDKGNLRQRCERLCCVRKANLVPDYRESKLFQNLPMALENTLHADSFAFHHQQYCITPDKLSADWHLLATQRDREPFEHEQSLEFVSLVEHRRYPYFGSQFHPERLAYESLRSDIESEVQNSRQCIDLLQYFAHVFVDACRASTHRFGTPEEELRHLIDNFPLTFTAHLKAVRLLTCYLFTKDVDYAQQRES